LKASNDSIYDGFLHSKFLLVQTSNRSFEYNIDRLPLFVIFLEKNNKAKNDYYLFRPDGWLAAKGNQKAIEKFINNYPEGI
jgi:hypothetical protein